MNTIKLLALFICLLCVGSEALAKDVTIKLSAVKDPFQRQSSISFEYFTGEVTIPSEIKVTRGFIHTKHDIAKLTFDANTTCEYVANRYSYRSKKYYFKRCSDNIAAGEKLEVENQISLQIYKSRAYFIAIRAEATILGAEEEVIEEPILIPGPQGPQGEVGPMGPQGPQGEVGPMGPQGIQGLKGDTGTQGLQGPRGYQGIKGDTGAQGPQGIQGEAGAQGLKGDTGAQGPQGIQGEAGPQGPAGSDATVSLTAGEGIVGNIIGSTDTIAVDVGLNAGQIVKVEDDGKINPALLPATSGGAEVQVAYIKDIKDAGVHGGTCTSGVWNQRDLTNKSGDDIVALNSDNTFTLEAGTYDIEVIAPAFLTNMHGARLTSNDGTIKLAGTTGRSHSTYGAVDSSIIKGVLTVTSSTTFRVEHKCQTSRDTIGLGMGAGFNENEVYTQIKITKTK